MCIFCSATDDEMNGYVGPHSLSSSTEMGNSIDEGMWTTILSIELCSCLLVAPPSTPLNNHNHILSFYFFCLMLLQDSFFH